MKKGRYIRKAIANHLGIEWQLIDLVSLEYGYLFTDEDSIDLTETTEIIKHPSERHVPDLAVTKLPDIVDGPTDEPKVLMKCGHAISPDNLYQCCTVKYKDGEQKVKCFVCQQIWDFEEITEKTQMTPDEKIFWGMRLSMNMIRADNCLSACPKCGTYCKPIENSATRVSCRACLKQGIWFEFCLKCLQNWKIGHKCQTKEQIQQLLNDCPRKTIDYCKVENVPSIRLCPNCGTLIEHISACKETRCHHCEQSFCFICLTRCTGGGLQCGIYDVKCEIAPVQTAEEVTF